MMGLKFWHRKDDVVFFMTGAVIGPIGETVCISFGTWQYVNPTMIGIPVWLPLAWEIAAILVKRLSETFVKIEIK
jgi:hypothetical protein